MPRKITARVVIEGDAETIIKSLSHFPAKDLEINVSVGAWAKGGFCIYGGYSPYTIPSVHNGNSQNALRAIEGLFNQSRITPEEYNFLLDAIRRISIYTK